MLPGTKYITVGGAIASDVHGKNHFKKGSITDHVLSMGVILEDNSVINCSRTQNEDLFFATCGGMGLTGFIYTVVIQLEKLVQQEYLTENVKSSTLKDLLHQFEDNLNCVDHMAAWLELNAHGSFKRSVFSTAKRTKEQKAIYPDFLFPLDRIKNWNKFYGRKGFIQYQGVISLENVENTLNLIFRLITKEGIWSSLIVIKRLGAANKNLFSFPMEGFTLSMDFKLSPNLFPCMEKIDDIVINAKGKVYLGKDMRLSKDKFRIMYPGWKNFIEVVKKYNPNRSFTSLLAERLGL